MSLSIRHSPWITWWQPSAPKRQDPQHPPLLVGLARSTEQIRNNQSQLFDLKKITQMWDNNAKTYIKCTKKGADLFKRYVNFPALLNLIPRKIEKLRGLDIGCGPGNYTEALSDLGANMTGIDCAATFIRHCKESAASLAKDIRYYHADATALPFESNSFDFVTSIHCFMDIPPQHLDKALTEAHRVMKKDGFLLMSIPHPLWSQNIEWIRDEKNNKTGIIVKDYFKAHSQVQTNTWSFEGDSDLKLRTPLFSRTIADWTRDIAKAGFVIDAIVEPCPSEEVAKRHPELAGARIAPYGLIFQCHKIA